MYVKCGATHALVNAPHRRGYATSAHASPPDYAFAGPGDCPPTRDPSPLTFNVSDGILGLRGNTLSSLLATRILTSYAANIVVTRRSPLLPSSVTSKRLCTRIAIIPMAMIIPNWNLGFQGGKLGIERHIGAAPDLVRHGD